MPRVPLTGAVTSGALSPGTSYVFAPRGGARRGRHQPRWRRPSSGLTPPSRPSRYSVRPHHHHLGPHNGERIMASRLGSVRRTVAAAAVAGLALAGCGGNSGSATGQGSASGGKTKLIWFMWSGSNAEVQAWKHLGDLMTKKYPDIELTFQTASFTDYFTKLAAQSSGGNAPCLLGMQSLRAPGLGQLLQPLDDLAKKQGVDLAQFDPAIVKGLQVDGKQVAIPYDL